ncbi:MAG: hypothetical protein ABIC95_05850 [archaeon]
MGEALKNESDRVWPFFVFLLGVEGVVYYYGYNHWHVPFIGKTIPEIILPFAKLADAAIDMSISVIKVLKDTLGDAYHDIFTQRDEMVIMHLETLLRNQVITGKDVKVTQDFIVNFSSLRVLDQRIREAEVNLDSQYLKVYEAAKDIPQSTVLSKLRSKLLEVGIPGINDGQTKREDEFSSPNYDKNQELMVQNWQASVETYRDAMGKVIKHTMTHKKEGKTSDLNAMITQMVRTDTAAATFYRLEEQARIGIGQADSTMLTTMKSELQHIRPDVFHFNFSAHVFSIGLLFWLLFFSFLKLTTVVPFLRRYRRWAAIRRVVRRFRQ